MKITINGEVKCFEASLKLLTLQALITHLGHNPRLVVVEFNGKILNPEKWKKQPITEGDNLEIVTIVGGGS